MLVSQLAVAQTTTIYFIRHAEKADKSSDPVLSEEGNPNYNVFKHKLYTHDDDVNNDDVKNEENDD